MKAVIFLVLILLLVLLVMFAVKYSQSPATDTPASSALHVYATWDTMELDKCVAAWLIVRFIDKDAKYVFYPQGTEIKQGIAFDVPGAAWSRKH